MKPTDRGKITFNFSPEWLTDKRRAALSQLAELGVDIYSLDATVTDLEFMRIMIPHSLRPFEYIQIAYQLALLLDETFQHPPIIFVDGYPQGVKYRVRSSEDD